MLHVIFSGRVSRNPFRQRRRNLALILLLLEHPLRRAPPLDATPQNILVPRNWFSQLRYAEYGTFRSLRMFRLKLSIVLFKGLVFLLYTAAHALGIAWVSGFSILFLATVDSGPRYTTTSLVLGRLLMIMRISRSHTSGSGIAILISLVGCLRWLYCIC